MKNSEFYKKRLKTARKKLDFDIEGNEVYTWPLWPFRKITNLLGAGITKIPKVVSKEMPIARFIEEEKNEDKSKKQKNDVWKTKVGSKAKFYNFSDIKSEVLKKIMDSRTEGNTQNQKNTLNAESILHIMNDCISGENNKESLLSKQNEGKKNFLKSMIRNESNAKIRKSDGKNIDYNTELGENKNTIARKLNYYIKKYLEKKPKDRQFIEPEDLECKDGEKTLHPLSDYIDHHMKKDRISYGRLLFGSALMISIGVMMVVAMTNPIVVGIGATLIALGALAVIATAVYKNKGMDKKKFTKTIRDEEVERFEKLKQEVEEETNRRQEEKNERKMTTGANSEEQQTQLLNPLVKQEGGFPSLDGIQLVDPNTQQNLNQHQQNLANQQPNVGGLGGQL